MKFIRTGLVIASLALSHGAASAGLIEFTWQVSGDQLPPPLQPGATPGAGGVIDFPANVEIGLGGFGVEVARGGVFGSSPYQGSLGNVTWSGYATQAPFTPSSPTIGSTQFYVNVTLTDTMSGQSANLSIYGQADTIWANNGSWLLESSIGGGNGHQSVRLGNNLYTVWIPLEGSTPNSTAPISTSIDVSVASVATPEPGTLALVVCGLSLVGFRRIKRVSS